MYLKYKEADVQSQREMKAASMLKGAARATQSCCQMHSETGRGARKPGLYHGRLCTAFTICFLKYFTKMGASEKKKFQLPYPSIDLDVIYFMSLKCFPFRKLLSVRVIQRKRSVGDDT